MESHVPADANLSAPAPSGSPASPASPPSPTPLCSRAFVALWLTFRYAVNAAYTRRPACRLLPPVTSVLLPLRLRPSCHSSCERYLFDSASGVCLISAIVHNFYCACCELVSVTPDELTPAPSPLSLALLYHSLAFPGNLHCRNFLQFKISAIIDSGHLRLGVGCVVFPDKGVDSGRCCSYNNSSNCD